MYAGITPVVGQLMSGFDARFIFKIIVVPVEAEASNITVSGTTEV